MYELNHASARLAREVADEFELRAPDSPRYVAGVLGPTNRTASLSPDVNDPGFRNVGFDELVATYTEAVRGLLDGGADLLLVETIFDTLNAKAALFAIESYFETAGLRVPVMISGTITDASGRTLSGQTTEAFWNSVAHARPLSVGLNCALGAQALRQYVQELSRVAPTLREHPPQRRAAQRVRRVRREPRSTWPRSSASLPRAAWSTWWAAAAAPRPAHIRAIAEAVAGLPPRVPLPRRPASASAGWNRSPSGPESMFVNVGERTNVTGSRKFAQLVLAGDYDAGAGDRATAGGERRADDRRQHGRGNAGFPAGHDHASSSCWRRSRTSAGCR